MCLRIVIGAGGCYHLFLRVVYPREVRTRRVRGSASKCNIGEKSLGNTKDIALEALSGPHET